MKSGVAVAKNADNRQERALGDSVQLLQGVFDAAIDASGAPGGVVSIMFADGKCLTLASGMADRELDFPMTIDHRFSGGSISKQFVGALIIKASLEKKVALDEPISNYLRKNWWFDYLVNSNGITIRMLLAHTAGLADLPWAALSIHPAFRNALYGPNEDYARILAQTGWFNLPAVHGPGEKFAYSDTHYVVLAFILEAVAKERFEIQVHRFLYRMGMMFTEPNGMAAMSGVAKGYLNRNSIGVPKALEVFGESPIDDGVFKLIYSHAHGGGWVVTNPRDLARWAWQWFSGRLLGGNYIESLTKETFSQENNNSRIGLANTLIVQNTLLGTELAGSGFDYGYGTYAAYYPDYDIAVVVQINTNLEGGARPIMLRISEHLQGTSLIKQK